MNVLSEWLAPLPDKSLPALEIRTDLLKILQDYSRLEPGTLKQSGLGRAVMLLYKHPRETKENKALAARLISDWARPIFQVRYRVAAWVCYFFIAENKDGFWTVRPRSLHSFRSFYVVLNLFCCKKAHLKKLTANHKCRNFLFTVVVIWFFRQKIKAA